jgi:hypothetical protein
MEKIGSGPSEGKLRAGSYSKLRKYSIMSVDSDLFGVAKLESEVIFINRTHFHNIRSVKNRKTKKIIFHVFCRFLVEL